MYSLISACALCQNGTITSWSQWATNCATVFDNYPQPIPVNLHVPAYAYLPVEAEDTFDQNAAQKDANATESTALPSSAPATSTLQPSTTTSQTPISTASAAGQITIPTDPHSTAIGAGVVGGIFGLACLLLLTGLLIAYRRHRRSKSLRQRSPDSEQASQEASLPLPPGFRVGTQSSLGTLNTAPSDSMIEVRAATQTDLPTQISNSHTIAPAIQISSSSVDDHVST